MLMWKKQLSPLPEETGKAVEVKYVPVTVVEEEPEEQTIFEVVEQMPEFRMVVWLV